MLKVVLAALALLFAIPAAHAASFDCSKAGTAFEHAICDNPRLSEDDDILAQAYATALGGLSRAAADEVKTAQHKWLDYASRVCTANAQPLNGKYEGDDAINCLHGTFRSRIRQLEASRMEGGWRFYPIDRFQVERDTEVGPDDYTKVADKQFSTVKIDSARDVAVAFNKVIDKNWAGYADLFPKGSTEFAAGDPTDDYNITTDVSSVSHDRISLTVNYWWYGHGAAHGNYDISYLHFLTGPKRLLTAADIFDGDGWQKKVSALALADLKKQLEDGIWDDAADAVDKAVADPTRWNFSDEALIVQFQPYEVTAYAAGAPTATIAWKDIESLMADGAGNIVGYYGY